MQGRGHRALVPGLPGRDNCCWGGYRAGAANLWITGTMDWVFGVAAAAHRGALVVLTLVGLCFQGEERCLPVLSGLVLKSFSSSRRRREITYWCGREQVCENQHPGTRSNNVVFSSRSINQRSNLSLSGEVSHWEGDKLPSSP